MVPLHVAGEVSASYRVGAAADVAGVVRTTPAATAATATNDLNLILFLRAQEIHRGQELAVQHKMGGLWITDERTSRHRNVWWPPECATNPTFEPGHRCLR